MATKTKQSDKLRGATEFLQQGTPTQVESVARSDAAQPAERRVTTAPAGLVKAIDIKNSKTDVVEEVDPSEIEESEFANRIADDFTSDEFALLKREIRLAGGNVQPIKIMRIDRPRDGIKYVLIFGHRRLRAVKELQADGETGVRLRALIVQPMSQVALFKEMDRENRARADLRPYEQGLMYKKALDKGLFLSQSDLAEKLGLDKGNVSKAIHLAELPDDVLNAFNSRLAIQYRWGVALKKSLEKDSDSKSRLLRAAKGFADLAKEARPADKDIYLALIAAASPVEPKTKLKPALVEHTADANGVSFRVSSLSVTAEQIQKIRAYIESILSEEGPPG